MANPQRSIRLEAMEQAIRNDPLPEVQVEEPPIVQPLDYLSALPKELFYIIMNWLELCEQFTARRVCHIWKAKIEDMLNNERKECLKLNVKKFYSIENMEHDYRRVTTWKPIESLCLKQFEFAYKEPVIAQSELAQIMIWDNAFNLEAAQAFGRIFNQVKAIIIYWDTDDSKDNIDNLVALLSQFNEFNVVNTFGLILSGQLANSETLPKICTAINTHFSPLKQLHLIVPEAIPTNNPQQGELPTFELYPPVQLDKAIEFATNFSITGAVNVGNLLESVGQKLTDVPTTVRPQLESLSFLFYKSGDNQAFIFAALDSNKEKFVAVKRLLLVNIGELPSLERLLVYFPNVEQLYLKYFEPSMGPFNIEWIRAIKKLANLTELTLSNFAFERKSLGWGGHGPIDETVNLDQLRKLTFASPHLFFHLRFACSPIYTPELLFLSQLQPVDIGDSVRMRFSGLEELNMWSGDWEFHQTPGSTWQQLEQSLNRELPISLPQLPGLRISIQLRHPAMCIEHLAQSAISNSFYTNAMAISKAQRFNRRFTYLNQLLEQRQAPINLLNQNGLLVERAVHELILNGIRPLLAQAQAQVDGQIQVPENIIHGIHVLMQIPREIVAQVAREIEQE